VTARQSIAVPIKKDPHSETTIGLGEVRFLKFASLAKDRAVRLSRTDYTFLLSSQNKHCMMVSNKTPLTLI